MLAGVVVGTQLGLQATAFYLAAYLVMNVAAFAVVIARERVSERGDDIESLRDLSRAAPLLAWPMTIAMLALAGFPATAGFIGKFYLIDAAVAGDYAWLGIVIVVGSMISLAYYLRVVAIMWMGRVDVTLPTAPPRTVKAVEGWSPEADAARRAGDRRGRAARGRRDRLPRDLPVAAVRRRQGRRHVARVAALAPRRALALALVECQRRSENSVLDGGTHHMKLKPLGDRLIVQAIEEDETTASGIFLPETAKEKPSRGKVIAVGDGKWDEDGEKRIPLDVAEGDEVLYSKYGGTEVNVEGEELLVLRESDVLAKVA